MEQRYFEAGTEPEAMRIFWREIGFAEGKVDYGCNTDGRGILSNGYLGSLLECKLTEQPLENVFNQMKKYCKSFNAKGGYSIPKYGIYLVTSEQKFLVFDLEKNDYQSAKLFDFAKINDLEPYNPVKISSIESWLRKCDTQKGWIDETSIIKYNDEFFSKRGNLKKKKDDFIAEMANPTFLNIIPYVWQKDGIMERKLLDCLGSSELKKRLGAFFSPDYTVKKSTEYVRNIIKELSPDEDYVIVDRTCGSGNLEKYLTEEELSHCILNTIVFAEKTTLKGVYDGRVKSLLPVDESVDEYGCMINGDALTEQFNRKLIEELNNASNDCKKRGKKLVVIGLENPPYAEPGAKSNCHNKTSGNFVNTEMKKDKNVKGRASTDLSNQFIWSGFKWFFDYYVVYSPIKYWKSQHLIDKKFLNGIIVNRKDFHATDGGISIISWKNEDADNSELQLENCLIKKINTKINDGIIIEDTKSDFICKTVTFSGTPNYLNGVLTNSDINKNGCVTKIGADNIKKALPLFVANCYPCKDYTEKEVIMKSGDGGLAYQQDNDFLEDCFVWCCLTDKNKCWSYANQRNELCLCQNTKADLLYVNSAERDELVNLWKNVLQDAKNCIEYNSSWTYGLAQIENDLNLEDSTQAVRKTGAMIMKKRYPKLDADIKLLKEALKSFYDSKITPKLFQYELLK